jgi:hypothetical protein
VSGYSDSELLSYSGAVNCSTGISLSLKNKSSLSDGISLSLSSLLTDLSKLSPLDEFETSLC